MTNRISGAAAACLLGLVACAEAAAVELPQLSERVLVYRDSDGIARIHARNARDLYFVQGWVHAEDRLFQMDLTRRQPSGDLAELFGPSQLAGDVQARTIGLRRAAVRSRDALSTSTLAALQAYADGVNAWVAAAPVLPPEYALLGFDNSGFRAWNVVDSLVVAKAIAFNLSFDLDTGLTEAFLAYLQQLGPQGASLFSEDVFRAAPFYCASTVPDATGTVPYLAVPHPAAEDRCLPANGPLANDKADEGAARQTASAASDAPAGVQGGGAALQALARQANEELRRSSFLRGRLDHDGVIGSNEWAITRALGAGDRPIVANDPHLSLNTPSTFYPIGLKAPGLDVFGSSFAGAPFVVLGYNKHVHWGATTNPMDVTDTYLELVVPGEDGLPAATLFQGQPEPLERIPETFRFNAGGVLATVPPGPCALPGCNVEIPAFTFVVPRRNNGPIVAILGQPQDGAIPALSVQYTGFSATRELDTFRIWNRARNLKDFMEGLQYFDFGSQNWVYGDIQGSAAYFTSAELPLRADLQAGQVAPGTVPGFFPSGLPIPPWFVRDGTSGRHEWLSVANPQPGQAIPYEILPHAEMPQALNPAVGWFVNANNDPAGTTLDNQPLNQLRVGGEGIYYLNPGYDGFRAGTITARMRGLVAAAGEVTFEDMQAIQGDVTLPDAPFFVPFLLAAWDNAQSSAVSELAELADDERLAEAIGRLAAWDYTAPTGIRAGYDFGDDPEALPAPSAAEIDNSVAATIYSVWRARAIRAIVDASLPGLPTPGSAQAVSALRNLLENFDLRLGKGASGWEFFAVPGVADPFARRDIRLLGALADSLDRLAGAPFAPAFANSTSQDAYRWGRLHRIVLDHPFVAAFDVPPALGDFPAPLAPLPGIPTDGGFSTVDASSHGARSDTWSAFMFGSGPVRRFVGEPAAAFGSRAESIWAGGTSGVPFPGNPHYFNLLPRWLANRAVSLSLKPADASRAGAQVVIFEPAD
jgi:penicillin amidase